MKYLRPVILRSLVFASFFGIAEGVQAASAINDAAETPEMLRYAERWQKENSAAAAPINNSVKDISSKVQHKSNSLYSKKMNSSVHAKRLEEIKPTHSLIEKQALSPNGESNKNGGVTDTAYQVLQTKFQEATTSMKALNARLDDANLNSKLLMKTLSEKNDQFSNLQKENITLKTSLDTSEAMRTELSRQVTTLKDDSLQREKNYSEEKTKSLTTLDQLQKQNDQLSYQLSKEKQESVLQKEQFETTLKLLKDNEQALGILKVKNNNLDRQVGEAVAAMKEAKAQAAAHAQNLLPLIDESSVTDLTELTKKSPDAIENYATGVSFGQDITNALTTNESLGVRNNDMLILLGITDTLKHKLRLSAREIEEGMSSAQKKVRQALQNMLNEQALKGKKATDAFLKRKGVVHADSGFLYQVIKTGSGSISSGSHLRVAINESLADGTVIQNMQKNGQELSQKVGDFPPVFKEVLMKLKNHGSADILVPPALAYGDAGYPPKIPPGATMLYHLEIVDVE